MMRSTSDSSLGSATYIPRHVEPGSYTGRMDRSGQAAAGDNQDRPLPAGAAPQTAEIRSGGARPAGAEERAVAAAETKQHDRPKEALAVTGRGEPSGQIAVG